MKEFAMKHPILTFLLADAAIGGVVKIVCSIANIFSGGKDDNKEEPEDEPACDIQQDT